MGCANCGLVTFASVPTSPWTVCTGSRQESRQVTLGKLVLEGPGQGLAFPGKMTKVKPPGSSEAGQTPSWACNHLISRDNNCSLKPHLPQPLTVQQEPPPPFGQLLYPLSSGPRQRQLYWDPVFNRTGEDFKSPAPERRQWRETQEGLAPARLSRLPEAALSQELVSSGLETWQGSVNTSVWSQLQAAQ